MSTQLIKPSRAQPLDIRCNVGDVIVANLATHMVFFFERPLETTALARAFAHALTVLPIFAGRMTLARGRMGIRCRGQGVPFTVVSSDRTLEEAIRSTVDDTGIWLVDPVNGAIARWGWGPVCRVRVTRLADDATAIGFSWHHAVGDMQTLMHFMNTWVAAAADTPCMQPLIIEDRAAYLDEHLRADGARRPGVRCLGLIETARCVRYLIKDSPRQRTLSLYFGEAEIARMRNAFGSGTRLSANDVVCAVVSEALMNADPLVGRRALAIVVNTRKRCGLDPRLTGNIITTMNVDLFTEDAAYSIAQRIRHHVDHFDDEHCDMRINQQFLDIAGAWRGARCVSTAFNPARWNPLITNLSGFGLYRIEFEKTVPSYCTMVMTLPVAGGGALMEGAQGRGLLFQMSLPPEEFTFMSRRGIREHLHRFRCADDDIPRLHRELHA
ncbi:acyltransferase [Mycolicibacterium helvum]|uniref:Acyltransferase n=1 Tax=Mycolicibacterium helvum TaxID=1534349 RepID=A0A7I7T0P1_9MYCO|nr:acyltransferase [Mycolicibacterium helvum]BBY62608.1 hypothetical protein MHEL_08510 [Mycolicibacterium helvum]